MQNIRQHFNFADLLSSVERFYPTEDRHAQIKTKMKLERIRRGASMHMPPSFDHI